MIHGERNADDSQIASASEGTNEDFRMDGPPRGITKALTIPTNGQGHL
jgi:hypothetical protein